MYKYNPIFGYEIHGKTLGGAWISLVQAVYKHGEECYDEGRKRLALRNVRLKAEVQDTPDSVIHKYGNLENIQKMITLTFSESTMYDFDKTPSFNPGSKSYYQRIKEGKLIDFVVERLSIIPESKKAIIVFPTYEDYERVLRNPKDDYLPCLVSIQFRLQKRDDVYCLDTTCYFRSLDVFQKAHANFEVIGLITKEIVGRISVKLNCGDVIIKLGFFDCLIADAHIYENTLDDCKKIVDTFERSVL